MKELSGDDEDSDEDSEDNCSSDTSDEDSNSVTTSERTDYSSTTGSDDGSRENSRSLHFPCEYFSKVPPDTDYAKEVQRWTINIPIGLGLCPWAGKSHYRGHLRFVTCLGATPENVVKFVNTEIDLLVGSKCVPALSSTLIICPHVEIWNKDFQIFEDFVKSGIYRDLEDDQMVREQITFVAFHPNFLRWRGLPRGLQVGSIVQSYWGMIGSKSLETAPATIVETDNRAFGKRKIKVRFHDKVEGRCEEQFVPIHWIDHSFSGPPLPDNIMHRAPYPTIHLIANKDLVTFQIRDISRVKRKNAQRMMRLGWEGLEKKLNKNKM